MKKTLGALRCRTACKSKSSAEKKRRSGATEATQLKAKIGARANESDANKETRSHTEGGSTEARRKQMRATPRKRPGATQKGAQLKPGV